MPNRKQLLGAAALTVALAGGGVAGALLGSPSLSGAQDSNTTTTTQDNQARDDAPKFEHFGHGLFGGADLSVAADAIGISEDDLRSALEDGKSIADVAAEHNVDLKKVTDALGADATKRLDEAVADIKANLPDRIDALVNHDGLPEHGPGHFGVRFGGLDAAATAIGISEDDLKAALEDGQSIADVANAHSVDVQKVIDAMVADATKHIDQAVTDGRLDADEAANLKEDLPDRITNLVNGDFPRPPFGHRGFGPPPGFDGPDDSGTTS